jgi:ribosome biogenesis GTPase / thiamine phosphate phosphatase
MTSGLAIAMYRYGMTGRVVKPPLRRSGVAAARQEACTPPVRGVHHYRSGIDTSDELPGRSSGDIRLGWTAWHDEALAAVEPCPGPQQVVGRVGRLDRGWSTVVPSLDVEPVRVRNVGAEVAVGDWVVLDEALERVESVLERSSAFTRRASFEGNRAVAHTIAANIDVVGLVHSLTSPPNQRRLERELVLAFDSGASPVIVLTKADLIDDPAPHVEAIESVAVGVPVVVVSGRTGDGLVALRARLGRYETMALLGASGVGKSTIINALVGGSLRVGEVRGNDQRGRHTTTAVELVALPDEPPGWLIDTPGVRAVSLWSSGHGIERAFRDVFDLADRCRFRDCKHEDEPGCAVQAAMVSGELDARRLDAMARLVAEEAALEHEQWAQERAQDRRRHERQTRAGRRAGARDDAHEDARPDDDEEDERR